MLRSGVVLLAWYKCSGPEIGRHLYLQTESAFLVGRISLVTVHGQDKRRFSIDEKF